MQTYEGQPWKLLMKEKPWDMMHAQKNKKVLAKLNKYPMVKAYKTK